MEIQVLPVKPVDKKAAFAIETGWMEHRLEAFERTRAAAGVTMERVSLMETPAGNFTIAHREGSKEFGEVVLLFRNSTDIFDVDMKNRGRILHGLTEEEQIRHRVPLEVLVDHSTAGDDRRPWHMFAAAVTPGATPRLRAFAAELAGARRKDLSRLAASAGLTVMRAALYDKGSRGEFSCWYIEGTSDDVSLPRALASAGAFGDWFATEFDAVHGSDIRKALPYRPVGVCWDWAVGAPNDPVAPISAGFTALFKG